MFTIFPFCVASILCYEHNDSSVISNQDVFGIIEYDYNQLSNRKLTATIYETFHLRCGKYWIPKYLIMETDEIVLKKQVAKNWSQVIKLIKNNQILINCF